MYSNTPARLRPWLRLHRSRLVGAACLAGWGAVVAAQYAILRHPDEHPGAFPATIVTPPADILKQDGFKHLSDLSRLTETAQRDIEAGHPSRAVFALDTMIDVLPRAANEDARCTGQQEGMLRRRTLVDAAAVLGTYTTQGDQRRSQALQAVETAIRHLRAAPIDGRMATDMLAAFPESSLPRWQAGMYPTPQAGQYGLR